MDVDDGLHFEHPVARIFDSPLDIRNVKGGRSLPVIAHQLGVNLYYDLVFAAVQDQHAVQFHIGTSRGRDLAFNLAWPENSVGVLGSLEDFLMHPFVARAISRLSARGIYGDFSARFACFGLEAD